MVDSYGKITLEKPKRGFKELHEMDAFTVGGNVYNGEKQSLLPVVQFKKLDKVSEWSYAHKSDAGMDIRSNENVTIMPRTRCLVKTGISVALPEDIVMMVCPRSGMAIKQGVTVLNAPGIVDSGYRGEVGVILYNAGDESVEIKAGDRIAQAVFQKVVHVDSEWVETLPDSDRGSKGFGSTGS